jgi:hypothetical protein
MFLLAKGLAQKSRKESRVEPRAWIGLIGCWLVPGFNILWMIEVLKRNPKKVDLNKWIFVIE